MKEAEIRVFTFFPNKMTQSITSIVRIVGNKLIFECTR